MKKYVILWIVMVMVWLTACGTVPSEGMKKINTMEKLSEVNGVISVTEQSFSGEISNAVAYKVLYESVNGKLSADVVLPMDYADENKRYAVLLYFPQVNIDIDSLATKYAEKDIVVIRPYARGYDKSEGVRDLGGEKDLVDAKKLLELFDCATFVQNSKVFVAGSSEGSITALRLFAEDTEKRISGCAVIDVIADLPAACEFRGDGVKNLFTSLIGASYEEAPEKYDLRSAVTFSEKLDRPLLILHFVQNPHFSLERTKAFFELVKKTNGQCTYYELDDLSSDFTKDASKRLLSWIEKYNE